MLNALVPVALYYGLRAVGASVYLALLAGAVVPAVTTLGGVMRASELRCARQRPPSGRRT